jgi:hypothetical protein
MKSSSKRLFLLFDARFFTSKISIKAKNWLFDACFYIGKYLEFSVLGKKL